MVFDHFRQLRNKHFIHDENSYAQSIPTAFLNDGTKPYKIEAVTCTNVPGGTLGPEAHHGLCRLVKITIEWVAHEIDALEAQITLDLESHDYRDLWNKPTPSFKLATPADVEHRRGSK